MMNTGLVIVHIFASIFLVPQEFKYGIAKVEHRDVLVRGVSEETSEDWYAFLLEEGLEFSIRSAGRDLYVPGNAIDILTQAIEKEELSEEAGRSLKERRIEKRVSLSWKNVETPSVCIAAANEQGKSQTIVFIVARDLPASEKGRVKAIVKEVLSDESVNNIQILGCVYEAEDFG